MEEHLTVAPDGKVLHSAPYNLKLSILRPDGATATSHIYLGFVPVDFELEESSSTGQLPQMRMKTQWGGLDKEVKPHLSDFLGFVRRTKTD